MPEIPRSRDHYSQTARRIKGYPFHHRPDSHIGGCDLDRIIASPSPEEFRRNMMGKTILMPAMRKFLHFPFIRAPDRTPQNERRYAHEFIQTERGTFRSQGLRQGYHHLATPWRLMFSNIRNGAWYTEDPNLCRQIGD